MSVCSRPAEFVRLSCRLFVQREVCLASATLSPFTLTGSCRDLTASAAEIDPTFERCREMGGSVAGPKHSTLSVLTISTIFYQEEK